MEIASQMLDSYRRIAGVSHSYSPARMRNVTCNAHQVRHGRHIPSGRRASVPGIDRSHFLSVVHPSTSLLEPDEVLHPLDNIGEPGPVRRLIKLFGQSIVVFRLAGRVHNRIGERMTLAEGIVQEQIGGIDVVRLVPGACGCLLDALLQETLEV